MPVSIGCFFLDTNIILSDILKENIPRIAKLKKDSSFHQVPCYVSESVESESYTKVKNACDFLGNVVRETIRYALLDNREKSGIPSTIPMSSIDIKALEELFSYYHNAVRSTGIGLPSPVTLVEEWAIGFLGDKLDEGIQVDIDHFLLELIKNLLALTSSIEDLYDELITFQKGFVKTVSIAVDVPISDSLQTIGLHKPDCDHVASAISYQMDNGEKTIFVTLDFASILDKRDLIWKQFKIECCDPLYALHHLL